MLKNKYEIYYSDNLELMKKMSQETIDLIYLDPPFNSARDYNLLYSTETGNKVKAQITAFQDTWEINDNTFNDIKKVVLNMHINGLSSTQVKQWESFADLMLHVDNSTLAYITYMALRLIEMYRILKKTGSIYYHCDDSASHYIKLLMDIIFTKNNYKSEITWQRSTGNKRTKEKYPNNSDTILFYTKSNTSTYNQQYNEIDDKYIKRYSNIDKNNKRYRLDSLLAPSIAHSNGTFKWIIDGKEITREDGRGFRWTQETLDRKRKEHFEKYDTELVEISKKGIPTQIKYLETADGIQVGNIWYDIHSLKHNAKEKLGYPTQKPLALLDRIILTSSNEGDSVFDPFGGCGTTLESAIINNRRCAICDISIHAIRLIEEHRIKKYDINCKTFGIPSNVYQAQELASEDPKQFETWIVEKIGAIPNQVQQGDKGIDGRLWYGDHEILLISVKGGHNLNPAMVRDLKGTLTTHKQKRGLLILAYPPTKGMLEEMYNSNDSIQILTVEDIFNDKKINTD